MDFHITENSTRQTKGHSPKSFPIIYCTYTCSHFGNLPTLNNGLRIMDTEVMPQWTKLTYIFLQKQSRLTGVIELINILFLKTIAISRPFCTQGAFVQAKLSNTWHAGTGKGRHITGCTLCIKDTSLCYGQFSVVPQCF